MDRKPARWMCTLDERIVEHLAEESWSTSRYMAQLFRFNASRSRIEERCQILAYAGMIAPLYDDCNMYEITTEGQQYLGGELDAEELPYPSPIGIWT